MWLLHNTGWAVTTDVGENLEGAAVRRVSNMFTVTRSSMPMALV